MQTLQSQEAFDHPHGAHWGVPIYHQPPQSLTNGTEDGLFPMLDVPLWLAGCVTIHTNLVVSESAAMNQESRNIAAASKGRLLPIS